MAETPDGKTARPNAGRAVRQFERLIAPPCKGDESDPDCGFEEPVSASPAPDLSALWRTAVRRAVSFTIAELSKRGKLSRISASEWNSVQNEALTALPAPPRAEGQQ